MRHHLQKFRSRLYICNLLAPGLVLFGGLLAQPFVLPSCQAQTLLELKILDETVPPGGMLQMKVSVTEAKPILKGKQGLRLSPLQLSPFAGLAPLAGFSGLALFSPAGDASGVAVLSQGSAQFYFSSPLTSFGMDPDFPVMVMDTPVASDAVLGQQSDLTFDTNNSQWFDPGSQEYSVVLTPGVMTVGGTIAIAGVNPGGVVVPAGKTISIKGIGFQPDAQVDVDHAIVATSKFVSSKEIQITLTAAVNMEHRRVRVTNKSTNERAEYYPYQRTSFLGVSGHPLIASSYPLFSDVTYTVAYFKPVLEGSVFSGIALQNLNPAAAKVRLELYSAQGDLLTARNLSLATNSRMARDLAELFPGFVAGDGTTLKVRALAPINMLGLLGDDASGEVLPVEPSPTP